MKKIKKDKSLRNSIAVIIGAMMIVALVVYGLIRMYSRSTLPEGYPVASGDGTEFEGASGTGNGGGTPEAGIDGTENTGSAAGTDTTNDALAEGSGDPATEGITDIECAPAYLDLAAMEKAKEQLAGMSVEDKVAQLFFVSIDALTGVNPTTVAGDVTREKISRYPVGGIILFGKNITDPEQITKMTSGLHEFSTENGGIPVMIGVDEEGGLVARVAGNGLFPEDNVGAMTDVGNTGDENRAAEVGIYIGTYLKKYGFDIDFAPVMDVYTNPENTVIGTRAFGTTPEVVTTMAEAFRKGLESAGVQSCVKHFPGHGDTQADSHYGVAVTNKTLDELMNCEFIPFQKAVSAGADLVMVSHISVPEVTSDMTPASLSEKMVTGVLRETLGYDGVVVTDDLSMQAITNQYTLADSCIRSIQAGVDWVMVTNGFTDAYNAVLGAVQDGSISAERLDESVYRILLLKCMYAGMMT